MPNAFDPFTAGALALSNRIVMAPMTRSRADNPERAPTALHAQYYAQRAEAGLIIPDEQEDEVETFREFLEQVRPADFAG